MTYHPGLRLEQLGIRPQDPHLTCDGCELVYRIPPNRPAPTWLLDRKAPKGWRAKTVGEGDAERLQHWCPKCSRAMRSIPIAAAERIAKDYGYDQVVIIARRVGAPPEPHGEHITTYGVDRAHCDSAAAQGRALKRFMGWPEEKL